MIEPNKLAVSWDQFHGTAIGLAALLKDRQFGAILAISRGGLPVAGVVARELDIRVIETISLASYTHDQQHDIQVLKGIGHEIEAKRIVHAGADVLVLDDLADTGKTFAFVRRQLPNAHYACLFAKPQGRPYVDTYAIDVPQDTWIYMPWDTGFSFRQPIKGEG